MTFQLSHSAGKNGDTDTKLEASFGTKRAKVVTQAQATKDNSGTQVSVGAGVSLQKREYKIDFFGRV